MPIPAFSINGVLPPYIGPNGPGGSSEDMSPYIVSSLEVVTTLGSSARRKEILRGWLRYRAALRAIGFNRGFQWLDGSFVEDKNPRDLDVVSFLHKPAEIQDKTQLQNWLTSNKHFFDRSDVKTSYDLDHFFVDLSGSPEGIVSTTRYFLGLFSHRRGDDLWKGMLQVNLGSAVDDEAALDALGASVPEQGERP